MMDSEMKRHKLNPSLWSAKTEGGASNWWAEHVNAENLPDLLGRLEGPDRQQSVDFRAFVAMHEIASVLDCGGGPLIDWQGFHDEQPNVHYVILDSAAYYAEVAEARGAKFAHGSIEKIPARARSFDLVYARHVLLHLKYYKAAVREMTRVARRFVYVAMSIPLISKDKLRKHRLGFHSNFYGKVKLMAFCRGLPGVDAVRYQNKVMVISKGDAS